MRRLTVTFTLVALGLNAAGCATGRSTPARHTQSGRPEVTLANRSNPMVANALVNDLVDQGYMVVEADEYTASFEKPGGFWLNVLMGSRFNPETKYRLTFNFIQIDQAVRVVGSAGAVVNPGSGAERTVELTTGSEKARAQMQAMLDGFASRVGGSIPVIAGVPAAPSPRDALSPQTVSTQRTVSTRTAAARERRRTDPAPAGLATVESNTARAIVGPPASEEARVGAAEAYAAGVAAAEAGRWSDAARLYRDALHLDGSVATYHAALGAVLLASEQWADAEAEFSAALLLDVDNDLYRESLKEARARRHAGSSDPASRVLPAPAHARPP